MKRFIQLFIILTYLSVSYLTFAQQTNNWYFGSAAGFPNTGLRVDFTSGTPVVSTGYPLMTEEGSSSISDAAGNPLFYTDGVTVWDGATNAVLPGGTGLNGGSSSTQSAIIMPKPGSTTQWLIFTSGILSNPGTYYYTVTGTTPTGPFSVGAGTQLAPATTVGEGLFIIGSTKAGSSFWVIARDLGSTGQVRAWDVSNTGVVNATPVLSTLSGAGFTNTSYTSKIGTIKSNTCQNKLAFTYLNGDVDITGFDAATGMVTATARRINVTSTGGNSGSYGIEFSPNDAYLYISNLSSGNLYKYDIVANTVALMGSVAAGNEAGQLQAGPDGKIYMANRNASPATAPNYLASITNPGAVGAVFTAQAVLLSGVTFGGNFGFVYRGLPTFPKSLVVNNPVISPGDGTYCTNTAINLSYMFGGSVSTITWSHTGTGGSFTPGGATSTSNTPSITFTSTGAKTVTLTIVDACGRNYSDVINLTIVTPAVPSGTVTCTGTGFTLDNPAVDANEPKYVWRDGSGGPIIGIGTPVTYAAGSNSAMPSQICVEVANTASTSSSGSSSIGNTTASLSWAANNSPHTSPAIGVLSSVLVLKSFSIKFYTCTATLNVTIRDGSSTIIYNENVPITGCASGSIYTIAVNTTLTTGSGYTITISGTGAQFYGGAWAGGTNAGQVSYAAGGVGTNTIANIQYDYKNFSVTSGCTTPQCYTVSCTLPVELYDFTATRENKNVFLNWITSSEHDNDYFVVERSADGENFQAIGTVDGKGNSSELSFYTFTDVSPMLSISYYRLVQYDMNGDKHTSPVRVVLANEEETILVYPNPSAQQFNVVLPESYEGSVISVRDILGREVHTQTLGIEDANTIVLNADWPKGHYILQWTSETTTKTIQIVKE